jgi:uncharacterized repeat protein (TIGR03803 family)
MKPTDKLVLLSRILAVVAILTSCAWAASSTQVVYSFAGEQDGEYTDTDLVTDNLGNIYGTSVQGGDFGSGTVFQLAPSGNGWIHTVLYSFTGGRDGGEPYKGVTLDSHGNLYGTAVTGGAGVCEGGCGVVYKLTNSGGIWTQRVIHYFSGGSDGSGPGSGLTIDKAGNLYGMTPTGGADGLGTIYKLSPQAGSSWGLRVLHTFTGGSDGGSGSAGRLLLDVMGNLYGVATTGGANGAGTAFELQLTANGFAFKTLYAFKGQPDAGFPYGGLIFDKAGNLYGTTYYDGANDLGSVYKLSHLRGMWTETVLYSFTGERDGSGPISTLVADPAGNLYGTASEGGAGCGCGTIFRMRRGSDDTWKEGTAYRFTGAPNGAFPYNGMVVDAAGNIYGATVHGGSGNDGTIYSFTP